MSISTVELRDFAQQCLRWSEETGDPGQRDLIARVADSWINIATVLDRRLDEGFILAGDLRQKLD